MRLGSGRWSALGGGLVVVLLLAAGAATLAWDGYRHDEAQAESMARNDTVTLAAHARQSFNAANQVLLGVQERIRQSGITQEAPFRAFMASRVLFDSLSVMVSGVPQIRVLGIVGDDGELLTRSTTFPAHPVNISRRAYFQMAMRPGFTGLTLSAPRPNRVDGALTLFLARQITAPDGTPLGVISVGVAASFFESFYSDINLGQGSAISLFRSDGILLARSPPRPELIGKSFAAQAVFRLGIRRGVKSALITVQDRRLADGGTQPPRLVAFQLLDTYPLVVNTTLTRDSYLAHWRRQTAGLAAVTTLMALLIIALSVALQRVLGRLRGSEAVLSEQSRALDITLDAMEQGILLITPDRRVPVCNRRARVLLDLPADPAVGPGTVDDIRALQYARGEFTDPQTGVQRQMTGGMSLQEPMDYERTRPNGTILRVNQVPLEDGGAVRIFTDITRQRQVEAQLLQAQRLDAVGQMTAGIAHDFNNLLGVIVTNLDMLHEDFDVGAASVTASGTTRFEGELVERARNAALTAADLVRGLLAFSRQRSLQIEPIETEQMLTRCGQMLRQALGERLVVNTAFAAELWPVQVDAAQIEMVLLNLALNARDAAAPGGVMWLKAENITIPAPPAAEAECVAHGMGGAPKAGDYVVVSVVDAGIGMDKATLARAFEPFFSTKGPGAGSGPGLSMVFGTMRQLGSAVTIASELGRGTSVSLYLPRSRMAPTPPPKRPDGARLAGLRVMLVEDNTDLRETAQSLLALLGHDVVAVADAAAALALWARDRRFDLVFSDVVMPGAMNGVQLVLALRKDAPGLKVLLTSGFAELTDFDESKDMAGLPMLQKPYRKDDLAAVLRQIFTPG